MSGPSDVFHHDGLTCWGPVGEAKMESLLELIRLVPGARVVDVGCGKAEEHCHRRARAGSRRVV